MPNESLLLHNEVDNSYIILLLYVNDMLIARASIEEFDKLKRELTEEFSTKD